MLNGDVVPRGSLFVALSSAVLVAGVVWVAFSGLCRAAG